MNNCVRIVQAIIDAGGFTSTINIISSTNVATAYLSIYSVTNNTLRYDTLLRINSSQLKI